MKAYMNRIFGKRDACRELAQVLVQIVREGYQLDEVMIGAVLDQYRRDKLEVVHRFEDWTACTLEDEDSLKAYNAMIEDDKGSVDRLCEYFVPMDKDLNKSLKSILQEMLEPMSADSGDQSR